MAKTTQRELKQEGIDKIAEQAMTKNHLTKRDDLIKKMAAGQLAFWPESERGIPNAVARCALFSTRNHREPRLNYPAKRPAIISVYGGGEMRYFGEELRQDDCTVWLQLIHLAKDSGSEWVSFTRHSFLKAIGWPVSSTGYARLDTTIRRLLGGIIEGYSGHLDLARPIRMVADYEIPEKDMNTPVRVRVYDPDSDLLFLFERLYSRLEWDVRLGLSVGIAQWLHTFYCTHMEPHALRLVTLADAAEIETVVEGGDKEQQKQRMRDVKKLFKSALTELVEIGFLTSFQITKDNLVYVVRSNAPGSDKLKMADEKAA